MRNILGVLAVLGALALAPKVANAQSVTIACEPSNLCFSDATGISYNSIAWQATTTGTDAIFPASCANKEVCRFYCPRKPGFINIKVNYVLNGQVAGSASARARCTAQDI
ncbi:hypothetical protein M2650_09205 [Luteimonas sp. SX5]|uniref:Secreted protein n=1 Tax=Luteimonas galliterrae TaxID=2940486 RepID=A0ABT0MIU9_9GAMM|nr:hypothetical protein [Luteimonas galliterrae]MCL1634806.1 hypothetical protein [Luteimonas galliterrae]